MTAPLLECPFCGVVPIIFIGDACGAQPNGYVSLTHTCDSGLFIEWFEEGKDTSMIEKAWNQRCYKNHSPVTVDASELLKLCHSEIVEETMRRR